MHSLRGVRFGVGSRNEQGVRMPALPISPLSPELTLIKPIGSSETRLGPIPNVADGIPGIGGIGSVELPGVGILKPGDASFPQIPNLLQPAPSATAAPITTAVPSLSPAPEVTPFPGVLAPQPTSTPTPGPSATSAPTPAPSTVAPQMTTTPVPSAGQLQQPAQGSPYATQPLTTTDLPNALQTPLMPSISASTSGAIPVKDTPAAQTFGRYLKDAVSNYSDTQSQADNMIQRLATGDKFDIHDVSLALQKASLTNSLAIQVRNRLVDAYQEVMRMQM
jgi:flagellar hook-basal body complex protein FliE